MHFDLRLFYLFFKAVVGLDFIIRSYDGFTYYGAILLCFLDADRPVVRIGVLRLHGDEVRLRFELVDDAVRRWEGRPWFDADERSVGLRGVPDAEVRHVREGHGDLLLILLRAQGDGMRHILQDDGVVVKQAVPQRQIASLLQRVVMHATADRIAFGELHLLRGRYLVEVEPVVLETERRIQRHIEARVDAVAETHGARIAVSHLKLYAQRFST